MTKSRLAMGLIGVGIAMILFGIVDAAGSADANGSVADANGSVAAVSTSVANSSTSTAVAPTTSAAPAESTTTTSTLAMTTITITPPVVTTSLATTTTSTVVDQGTAVETVEEFVLAFAAAIAVGDVDFLLDRLHPAVVSGFGPALCRSWIEGEILLLDNYELSGPVEGPRDQSVTTPAGTGTISDAFAAPVSFVFQGQSFDGEGGFALVGNEMFWLGQCR